MSFNEFYSSWDQSVNWVKYFQNCLVHFVEKKCGKIKQGFRKVCWLLKNLSRAFIDLKVQT